MLVLPVGPYSPVAPVKPVDPVTRKNKASGKPSDSEKQAQNHPAKSAAAMASHSTQAALDEMKLGG